MGRLSFVACVVLGSGCAQLLGIDPTSGTPAGADANPSFVSLQVERMSVGASDITAPQDLSALPLASYLIADGSGDLTRMPATLVGTDTWQAAIPGTPPVEFMMDSDFPDPYRRQLALPQRNIKFLYAILEHPNPSTPPVGDTFTTSLTLDTPYNGYLVRLYTLGAWTYHDLTAAELPAATGTVTAVGPESIAYSAFSSISGRPAAAITSLDSMVALHYTGNQLVAAGEVPSFDETSPATTINATMQAITTAALSVTVHPSTVATRLAAPRPAGATVSMAWNATAAPGAAIASNTGPLLDAATVLSTDSGAITAPYGNPFAAKGWASMFTWSSNIARTVTPVAGGPTFTAYAGFNDFATIAAGLDLNTAAPLPINVSLDGTQLLTDGVTLPIALAHSVALAVEQDTSTPALFYQFNVYELELNTGGTAYETHVRYTAISTDKTVTLPNDVFQDGKTYMIRVYAITGGYPSFAEGDLTNRQLPVSQGYLDAGIFTVMGQ